jgi:DNA polymerase elongation subunit (family B)
LIPQPHKETRVPFKICSYDIEASSSHGDFPLPKKSYKRLAANMVDIFIKQSQFIDASKALVLIQKIILTAFGHDHFEDVDTVYPKTTPSIERIRSLIKILTEQSVNQAKISGVASNSSLITIDSIFEKIKDAQTHEGTGDGDDSDGEVDDESSKYYVKRTKSLKLDKTTTIIDVLLNSAYDRDAKIQIANDVLTMLFPQLEGDKVTFIGSTFMRYGDSVPYLNHCIALGTCDPVDGAVIVSADTETDLLLKWTDLIQTENPDIIIGYNIFGFDYEFMFRRAEENRCESEFLLLSRKVGELCAKSNRDGDESSSAYCIENTKMQIASGEYDLRFVKMTGRLQIDMYAYFRRDFNFSSYKLDDVAAQLISDDVKKIVCITDPRFGDVTELYSQNLMGLNIGDFIHIELNGFTSDYYKNGHKFKVIDIIKDRPSVEKEKVVLYNVILINGHEPIDAAQSVRWGMAKDDVTPQDIFRLANGTSADRAIVAKYCIQDCNLVHHLMNKIDVITGYTEMANICSVPISFLVFRGQGIKLTSFVAKKCREKNTLMPDLEKVADADGYEGAIVLPPKCSMYMDNPVACVDYSSLYPSSMISQNFSHDSKVWTKEYDLNNVEIGVTGERDAHGAFIYDNLVGYEYIDMDFDTFKYIRKTPTSRAEKTKVGKIVCRWAQFPENKKGIMPSILEELLRARSETRKLIKTEKDPFMQNILDKRQLGYKVTANSLYGQCGSRTSTFYEKDVAAATTATGRMMIIYAKRIIEEVYGDLVYETAISGPVKCKAEYVYGDSVANYTPVYVRVNVEMIDICTIDELASKYGNNNWVKCAEKGKQEKEFCELHMVETWTENGWSKLHRVIRHTLAPHKKMMRILTHTGLVDVTDDHSLLRLNGQEISPKDVRIGTELLHHELPQSKIYYEQGLDSNELSYEFDTMIDAAICCFNLRNENKKFTISVINTIPKLFTALRPTILSDRYLIRVFTYGNEHDKNKIKSIDNIHYTGYVYDLTTENHHFAAGVGNMIVHNTDSVFFTFNLENPETGEKIRGKPALEMTIEIAQDAAKLCTQYLKPPMELSYEKTLMPFILLSKKRYVGMLYETDPNKGKLKYMGLSLKRRDSCDYLKDVYGGILNILMDTLQTNNIQLAITFLEQSLNNLVDGNVNMDKLTITKALRGDYKNPHTIGHKVLADRIGKRDPGNKPKPGDRMKFAFIVNDQPKALMGDKIETPEYILENKLKLDYTHYITNQLMKPLQQLFGLAVEQIWHIQGKHSQTKTFQKELAKLQLEYTDLETFMKQKEKICSKKIKTLLFEKMLTRIKNDKNRMQDITGFFGKK